MSPFVLASCHVVNNVEALMSMAARLTPADVAARLRSRGKCHAASLLWRIRRDEQPRQSLLVYVCMCHQGFGRCASRSPVTMDGARRRGGGYHASSRFMGRSDDPADSWMKLVYSTQLKPRKLLSRSTDLPDDQHRSVHISPHSEITMAMRGLLLAPHCTYRAAAKRSLSRAHHRDQTSEC